MKTLSGGSMSESEVLALVEAAVEGIVCSAQCITGLNFTDSKQMPFYASDGKFSLIRAAALDRAGNESSGSDLADLSASQKLRRATTADEAKETVTDALLTKLATILMLPVEVISAQRSTTSVTAFGLDSLTAIELRNWIGKELQAHLQVMELLTSGLIGDLAGLILKKTRLEGAWS
jgi:acyl carrier protein